MPRNLDVMSICDALEKLLARSSVVAQGAVNARVGGSSPPVPAKPKLSRAQIQKNYRERQKRLTRADRLAAQGKAKGEMD